MAANFSDTTMTIHKCFRRVVYIYLVLNILFYPWLYILLGLMSSFRFFCVFKKIFRGDHFQTLDSMLWLCKYSQSRFYIEYSIYTHKLILWIRYCQFFRNYMCDATHNTSFGLGLITINEVHRQIYYNIDNILAFFHQYLS